MNAKSMMVCLAVLLSLVAPLSAQEEEKESLPSILAMQAELSDLNRQLLLLEPYVTFGPGRLASLDSAAALQAGFSGEVLQLAQELLDAQNEAMQSLEDRESLGRAGGFVKLNLENREAAKEFFALAEEVDLAKSLGDLAPLKAGATHACGTFDNPVPSSAGARFSQGTYKTRGEAIDRLLKLGFHKTSSYVGTNDYTRGRSYRSTWGNCSSPRFRDHGTISSSSSKYQPLIQYGECNPELFSYSWPYWNWGAYCLWWHLRF